MGPLFILQCFFSWISLKLYLEEKAVKRGTFYSVHPTFKKIKERKGLVILILG